MSESRLLHVIGDIDEQFIEELSETEIKPWKSYR